MAERLAAVVAGLDRPHPVRVAIDGPSAAGKTTLAEELAVMLAAGGRHCIRASVDDFHHPRAHRYRQGRLSARGYLEDCFDLPALRRHVLEPLGPGGDRRHRTRIHDLPTDRAVLDPPALAPRDSVLLVDGSFLLHERLRDCWELAVLLDVDDDEVVRRAVRRDLHLGDAAEVEALYRERYLPAFAMYEQRMRPREHADLIVRSSPRPR